MELSRYVKAKLKKDPNWVAPPKAKNGPKPGDVTAQEPFRPEHLPTLRKFLNDSPLDLFMLNYGIGSFLRGSDIRLFTAGDIRDLIAKDSYDLRQKKTQEVIIKTLPDSIIQQAVNVLATLPADVPDDYYIFQSRKGKNQPITVAWMSSKIKAWAKACGFRGRYGSHTLRKTWGYIQRTVHNESIAVLMDAYGHKKESTTLIYLCIMKDDKVKAAKREI